MALKPCKECGKEISTSAKVCPHCGKETISAWTKPRGTGSGCLLVIVVIILFYYIGKSKESPSPSKTNIPVGGSETKTWGTDGVASSEIQRAPEDFLKKPKETALALTRLQNFTWKKGGFDNIMIGSFKIHNSSPYISVIILMAEKKTLEMPINIG